MDNLKLFFVVFAVHDKNYWNGHGVNLFAKSEERVTELLNKKFGEVKIHHIHEIPIEEGGIFYGSHWCAD